LSDTARDTSKEPVRKAVILGGGFAGLWAAYRLQQAGYRIEVLEKAEEPGGLLRTFHKEGFHFDLGPHVFLESHLPFYEELVRGDIRAVKGFYGFGFRRKQIPSPIHPFNLLRMLGLSATVPMTASMVWGRIRNAFSRKPFDNVDELLSARFGESINTHFFRNYIPKVTGHPARDVSTDWFTERYRFYQQHNLWRESIRKGLTSVRSLLQRRGTGEEGLVFYYPRCGAQMITDALVQRLRRDGGQIRLATSVERIEVQGNRVLSITYHSADSGRGKTSGDIFISTLPVNDLVRMMHPPPPNDVSEAARRLSYRRLALFYFILRRKGLSDKIQIYFPEKQYCFKRIYEPKNLDDSMGSSNRSAICVEVCLGDQDGPFRAFSEAAYPSVLRGLEDFYGLREQEIESSFTREAEHAYAIYEKGYERSLCSLARYLLRFDNLVSYGRQGSFRYNHLVDRVMDSFRPAFEFIRSHRTKREFLGDAAAKSDFF